MDAERQAYMAQRVEAAQRSIYADNEAALNAYLSNYGKAMDELLSELSRLYAKYAKDGKLTYTEMHRFKRYEKLVAKLDDIVKQLAKDDEAFVSERMLATFRAAEKELGVSLGFDFTEIPQSRVEQVMSYPWSGAMFSQRIWENKRALSNKLREILTRGMIRGSGITAMSKEIQEAFGSEAYVARRLVRTESMFFMNQAQLDAYNASPLVEFVQYVATYDERTCHICAPDDQRVFKLGSEIMLPRHPNCRCTYIPVVNGAENWSRFEPVRPTEGEVG